MASRWLSGARTWARATIPAALRRRIKALIGRPLPPPVCVRGDHAVVQRAKCDALVPLLRLDLPHERRGPKWDFLTPGLRREFSIVGTANVSANTYDGNALALIEDAEEGWVLDCGAGRRDTYYPNVVNFEIVDYDSTDVLGVGEALPFKDDAFSAVISVAVLEHVRDPFACAREIIRVLKPGGRLYCSVPFLQPLHAFPHHYFNMTHQGLRSLFERGLVIERQEVIDSMKPIWTLEWLVRAWAEALSPTARKRFLSQRLEEFVRPPIEHLHEDYVRELSPEKNFELACATVLFAKKPS